MSKFLSDLQEELAQVNSLRTIVGSKSGVDCSNKTIEEVAAVVDTLEIKGLLEGLSVTPSTSQQTFLPRTGYDGYDEVVVNAVTSSIDANIVPGNIKEGVQILGVTGTMGNGKFEKFNEVELPTGFGYGYHYVLSNGDALCSSESSSVIGIYLYNSATEQLTNIWNEGYNYQAFQETTNGVLISGSSVGLLFYDKTTKTISKIWNEGTYWTRVQSVSDGWLIAGNNTPILHFTDATDTLTNVYQGYSNWRFHSIGNNVLIYTENLGASPIILYNSLTGTASQVGTAGWTNTLFNTEYGCLICSTSWSSPLYYYDSTNDSVTQVYATSGYYSTFAKIGTYTLIGRNSSNSNILMFNETTKTVTELSLSSTYNRPYMQVVGTKCLMSFESSGAGVWIFDSSTQTLTQIYSSYFYRYFHIVGNDCLIAGNQGNSKLLLFDNSTNTISVIYSEYGWNYKYFCDIPDGVLIGGPSGCYGLFLYDAINKDVTQLLTTSNWGYFVKKSDYVIIGTMIDPDNYTSSISDKGIAIYDLTLKTASKVLNIGNYSTTTTVNGNLMMCASKLQHLSNQYVIYDCDNKKPKSGIGLSYYTDNGFTYSGQGIIDLSSGQAGTFNNLYDETMFANNGSYLSNITGDYLLIADVSRR